MAETMKVDIALIGASPVDSLTSSVAQRREPAQAGFASALAAESSDDQAALRSAEALIGTRVRAPEGGCGCDEFVSRVQPLADGSPALAEPDAGWSAGGGPLPSVEARSGPSDLVPGQVISLEAEPELTDHVHRAIVRNATEMITANEHGMIEVLAIPWGLLTPKR